MGKLVVTIAAGLGFLVLLGSVLPKDRKHWTSRVGRGARGVAAGLGRRRPKEPDPFEVLRIQTRLGSLADEIQRLECDTRAYARVRRLMAVRAAYDDLLEEGCRLAGVTKDDAAPEDPASRRWREERQLAERGWTW